MGNYEIRLARIEDVERIQQLSQELIEYEVKNSDKPYLYNLNWALSQDGYDNYKANVEHDWIYVVCIEGIIVGYMTCWINRRRPWDGYNIMEVGNLYIQKEYRGQGIGTELINKAKDLCKQKNIDYLKIGVFEHNKQAQEFYEKNGLYKYEISQYLKI